MLKLSSFYLIVIMLISGSAVSQVQGNHPMKTFTGEDGKIYWNKNLPFYINLSTSPSGEGGLVLKLDGKSAVEPYYFDTEGTNWIRTRWAIDPETKKTIIPQTEVLWPVEVDGMPPKTSISFDSEGRFVMDEVAYFTVDLKITLEAVDATSGVDKIYYSADGSFVEYTEPLIFDKEKEWDLKFYAVDKVGNVEEIRSSSDFAGKIAVDATPPTSNASLLEPFEGTVISPKSYIEINSKDELAGIAKIFYTIDEGSKKLYTGKISMSSLSEGEHKLTYYAIDKVGNEEELKTLVFYVDKTAPEVEVQPNGDQFVSASGYLYVSERSSLVLNSSDNKAGVDQVYYKVDGGSYEEYSSAIETTQRDGMHKLYYYGVDKVENKGSVKTKSFVIDNKKPALSYSIEGPEYNRNDTVFVNKESMLKLSPSDGGDYQSGVKETQYSVEGGAGMTYNDKFGMDGDGYRLVKISTIDQVGNSTEKEIHVFVDNKAPVLAFNFSVDKIGQKTVRDKNYLIYPSEVNLYLAATDASVGTEKITYSINGGTASTYSKPVSGFKKGTNYEILVKIYDKLGNVAEQMIEFAVE